MKIELMLEQEISQAFSKKKYIIQPTYPLRVSKLYKFCPREYFIWHLMLPQNRPMQEMTIQNAHYFRIGTVLHEIWQEYLGTLHGILYGNWFCKRCKTYIYNQYSITTCPKCREIMTYSEYEMQHNIGFTGHPDGIIYLPSIERLYLLEMKSIGDALYNKSDELPYESQLYQANIYACWLREGFWYKKGMEWVWHEPLDISGIIMLYIHRETPPYENCVLKKSYKFIVKDYDTSLYEKLKSDISYVKQVTELSSCKGRCGVELDNECWARNYCRGIGI